MPSKFRGVDGTLYHVRGRVDDRVVVRWWRAPKHRWEYAVWSEGYALAMGWSDVVQP